MVQVIQQWLCAGPGARRPGIGWRAAVATAALLGAGAGPADAAPVVSVAAPATATVGATVVVAVQIEDATALGAWQFDLGYDAALLQLDSVLEGPFLASAGVTLFSPGFDLTGQVSGISASGVDLTGPPSGSGTLAQFSFTTLAAGVARLQLAGVFLNLLDSGFTVSGGELCIGPAAACTASPVAAPGSLALSLLGVWLLCRQRAGRSRFPVPHSEAVSEPGAAERAPQTGAIKAQTAAIARAMARICNAECARLRGTSGRGGFAHSFSGEAP